MVSQIKDAYMASQKAGQVTDSYPFVTTGYVCDTNDPQQMGRIRAVCPTLGDTFDMELEFIPWCSYGAPFAGQSSIGSRGPGNNESFGQISYGTWFIPKIGSLVLVLCLDGDVMSRVWIGCLYSQHTPHTSPHGRWKYEDHAGLEKSGSNDPRPFGPYTGSEKFIEPLNTNLRQAFGNVGEPNFEWRTRAADQQVSSIDIGDLPRVYSQVQDDKDFAFDEWVSRQGYQVSRQDPSDRPLTGKNYDSLAYSVTTPGFHALSMDDRQENCRMRFRTSAGAQVIIDDTNERLYISTAVGHNWFEMDYYGNIDVYTDRRLSVHAKKDINFTSDESIRFYAKQGIHMYSEDEIRMQAKKDVSFHFEQNWRISVTSSTFLLSGENINMNAQQSMFLDAVQNINVKAPGTLFLTSGGSTQISGGGEIIASAGVIHLNGPCAETAAGASPPEEQPTKWTNRVPQHEPWGRVMTKDDFTHESQFPYDSKAINRVERDETIPRGAFWRR